ncbi:MAG: S8 family serine peptidase [bacterium]
MNEKLRIARMAGMDHILMNQAVLIYIIISSLCLFMFAVSLHAESAKSRMTYQPHEILVKFKSSTDEALKKSIRDEMGAVLIRTVRSIQVEYWRLPENITTEESFTFLSEHSLVEHVEPNYLYSPQMIPNDPHFSKQWFLYNTGQRINGVRGSPGADISAIDAWDIERGSSDIVIAVIDSGVAYDHPDLIGNVWTNRHEIAGNGLDDDLNGYVDDMHGWDFVNDDDNPSDYSRDLYGDGHGTHIAGIIAAQGNNGIGITGIMWKARIMPLQVFDLYETASFWDSIIQNINIISAFEYAVDNGAHIINCSFGSGLNSLFQYDVLKYADQHGVLVVAAAGNEGRNNDISPTYPASYDLPNIISVAATDGHGGLSSYSNYGIKSVDVGAPGGDKSLTIFSTIPPKRETLFYEDFESGDTAWIKEGVWEEWSLVYAPLFDSYVMQDSASNYHDNEDSYIMTINPVDAENYRGLNIQFTSLFQLERDYDFLFVEGSTDGINFSTVFPITGYLTGFSNSIQTVYAWGSDTEIGDSFYLKFRLRSDKSLNYDGVYIDDIKITGISWEFLGNEYGDKMGTSMATPVITGIAGLIWSHRPELTHVEVKDAILASVDKLESLNKKVVSGGRVNAARALDNYLAPSNLYSTDDTEGVVEEEDNGCFIENLY